jgi:two-component sensor histidine kinase
LDLGHHSGVTDQGESDAAGLAETRHKLANIFQLLAALVRMRMQRSRASEGQRPLAWMLETLEALAALQQQLHSPGGDDFATYLEVMAGQWRRRCAGRRIAIELTAAPLVMPESRASALALVANELVLNAITHGFPDDRAGVIRIEFERLGADRAALSVSDDGQGYDPKAVAGGFGLWLIAGLTSQVRGALTTTVDQGVRCRLEFAVPPSQARGTD